MEYTALFLAEVEALSPPACGRQFPSHLSASSSLHQQSSECNFCEITVVLAGQAVDEGI